MSEKLELVTRFEDLRAGMLVVLKHGQKHGYQCSRSQHRGMLMTYSATDDCDYGGSVVRTPSWSVEPIFPCVEKEGYEQACIGPEHVAERRLYRVVCDTPAKADLYRAEIRLLETAR